MKETPDNRHFFDELKDLLVNYVKNRIELARLTVFEKIARLIALLLSAMILIILGFFTVMFLSFMAGFYFSDLLHNTFYGFAIVAGFYVAAFIILLRYRRQLIDQVIINAVIRILFDEKDDTEKDQ